MRRPALTLALVAAGIMVAAWAMLTHQTNLVWYVLSAAFVTWAYLRWRPYGS